MNKGRSMNPSLSMKPLILISSGVVAVLLLCLLLLFLGVLIRGCRLRRRRTTWECDASDLLMENKEMRRTREVAVEERGGRMVWLPASQSLETKSPEPLSRLSTCAARAIALERMLGIREETGSTIRVVASLRRDV